MHKLTIHTSLKLAAALSLCLLLSAPVLQAQRRHGSQQQRINAYLTTGATFSQIEGDELKGFDKCGFTGGVGALTSLSSDNLFWLSVETDFSQRGAYNNTGDPYSLRDFTLNYVDIPLMFHFVDPYGGLMMGLGLDYSRLVQQPHGEIRYSPSYFVPDTSNMAFLRNDVALVGDVRFTIWEHLKLNVRMQYSLIPIKKGWNFTEYHHADVPTQWANNCYNSSISVRLIWLFGDQPKPRLVNRKHSPSHRR